jgi:hypothetical protein
MSAPSHGHLWSACMVNLKRNRLKMVRLQAVRSTLRAVSLPDFTRGAMAIRARNS